jgi:hypothetical protein
MQIASVVRDAIIGSWKSTPELLRLRVLSDMNTMINTTMDD